MLASGASRPQDLAVRSSADPNQLYNRTLLDRLSTLGPPAQILPRRSDSLLSSQAGSLATSLPPPTDARSLNAVTRLDLAGSGGLERALLGRDRETALRQRYMQLLREQQDTLRGQRGVEDLARLGNDNSEGRSRF